MTDTSKAALQGARVTLTPGNQTAVTGADGSYIIPGVMPGHYTVQVAYLGFETYTAKIDVLAGTVGKVDGVLSISGASASVVVRPEREVGEAEALNRQQVANNIEVVLPSEVINSLPNTNVADAAGRLPGVSLERDEGEGKYVQIRGTEPRLNNVTVDGIQVPSPENYRFVKLDTIPADLVGSIELNYTLTADMDADGIGGSLNLVTRQATDEPYFAIEGLDGHTPINGVRGENQEFATYGRRFLPGKKLGFLITGSYDWNGRGINDIEPGQAVNPLGTLIGNTFTPNGSTYNGPNTIDLRDYYYDRSRYGLGGTLDYKFGENTTAYFKGFYSYLDDFGEDSINRLNTGNFLSPTQTDQTGSTVYQDIYRRPVQQIFSTLLGGRKESGRSTLTARVAYSQAKITGEFNTIRFNGIAPTSQSPNGPLNQDGVAFNTATNDPFLPGFRVTATPNNVSIYDGSQYSLATINFQDDHTFERDVVGGIDYSHGYTRGNNFGTWQLGFKARDVIKNQIYNQPIATAIPSNILLSQFPGSRDDAGYYFGRYQAGPQSQATKILQYYEANPTQFTVDPNAATDLRGDFHVSERVYAGYLENTITHGRFILNAGVRVESTSDGAAGYQPNATGALGRVFNTSNYVYVLPSAGIKYNFDSYSDVRLAYSIGLARPNYGDLAPYQTYSPSNSGTASSPDLAAGNPALKATYAHNIDLLGEHYLKNVGVVQGGVFYKQIYDDIFNSVITVPFTVPGTTQAQNYLEAVPINGGSSHLIGANASWEQRLSRLPGPLGGTGFRFNYSYVTSVAEVPGRSDHPHLQRDAPNNWNVDLTYDKYNVSARMGLTHNDASIDAYAYQDGTPIDGSPTTPTVGGLHGPNSDTYFYPHTQVDFQVDYLVPKARGVSVVASFLDLNNEVFGFYNGAEQYPTQREYYFPTYTFGLRWTQHAGEGSVFHQ